MPVTSLEGSCESIKVDQLGRGWRETLIFEEGIYVRL